MIWVDAVGSHEVGDRRAFLQELRIGHHGELRAGLAALELFLDGRAHPFRGAHGHGGLVDHYPVVVHVAADVARGGEHIAHVGGAVLVRRGPHGDELHRTMGHAFLHICRETQTPRRHVVLDHLLQAGLVNGYDARLQLGDLAFVDVEAKHVVAEVGKAGAGHESDVTGSDNSDFHFPGSMAASSELMRART
jgi:hypothetical protein